MRKLALAVLFVSAAAGGFVGCGGSTPRKQTGMDGGAGSSAGASGTAGIAGTAGTGVAGDIGAAGTAGADAAAGAGGMAGGTAGADAAAGTGGEAGTTPPPPPYCDTHAKKPLPYNIGGDFSSIQILLHAATTWKQIANPNCDQTVFPPLNPPTTDGGTDGSSEAGTDAADGGDDTLLLALTDDAAADAADGPATDGDATDGGTTDGNADSGEVATNPIPKCFEFTYNPDPCVAANGGVAASAVGACYAGAIFQPAGNVAGVTAQGICIGDGAIQVTFEARANVAGQIIKFGSTREGMGSTEFYKTLTTSWATYSTAIPVGESYNTSSVLGGVWNGFSVVGEPQQNVGGTYILIRNITWSM
jgi:hypothetical protein